MSYYLCASVKWRETKDVVRGYPEDIAIFHLFWVCTRACNLSSLWYLLIVPVLYVTSMLACSAQCACSLLLGYHSGWQHRALGRSKMFVLFLRASLRISKLNVLIHAGLAFALSLSVAMVETIETALKVLAIPTD